MANVHHPFREFFPKNGQGYAQLSGSTLGAGILIYRTLENRHPNAV